MVYLRIPLSSLLGVMYDIYVECLWNEKERRTDRMWQTRIERGIKPTKLNHLSNEEQTVLFYNQNQMQP